ncbi:sulfur carrier protein ThiS [Marinimicrobium sp. C6131]|uniref:sulfur carrier protein ThiS n=1 Tax=Marinimicrobium sp. C6131 TaxID=3022676 RepID=UPI00223E7E5D|nr:sulfur carrier protein ThiS [Marinimicrobium sp. C6131]UZJ45134.1 sulfur carrier protein ThiS [Marinimicrobium sp. C6131]
MIEVSLNNERVKLPADTPLNKALQQWQYADQPVAIAINGEFVPRAWYPQVLLQTGDQIDIVQPVGGG